MLYRTLLAVGIACFTGLEAWGPHTSPQMTPQIEHNAPSSNNNHFPLNLDQEWYFKGDYLLWKAQEDDVDYGNLVNIVSRTINNLSDFTFISDINIKVKKPTWEWSSGVRLALGKYLPEHEQWDISAIATYFYNDADNTTKAIYHNNEQFFQPAWNTDAMGLSPKGSVNMRLNFYTWDLLAGREYQLTSTFVMHPFIGIRGALIEQRYLNRNITIIVDTTVFPEIVTLKTKFRAKNEFWGVGPRIGSDLSYSFGHGWQLLGSISGSFLYGQYDIHQKLNGFVIGFSVDPGTGLFLNLKDKDPVLRSNLEASFGLGWEKWVNNHTVRIAPSIVVEGAEWFSMNHWLSSHVPIFTFAQPDFEIRTRRHYGNLAFWGFNFNLQLDF